MSGLRTGVALFVAMLAAPSVARAWPGPEIVVRVVGGGQVPAPDLPLEARHAGTVPDPGAGPSANITFRIAPDTNDYGPLARLVVGRVSGVDIEWLDPAVFKADSVASAYVVQLLRAGGGSTNRMVPWAQMLPIPSILGATTETAGRRGSLRIWYAWPSVYAAYRDGDGRWWFSHWLDKDEVRLR